MNSSNSILYNKSYAFAVDVVKFYKENYQVKYSDIFRQLLKSCTSIGANMAEANGALTQNDFSAKVSIAYKEMMEAKYWLMLMRDVDLLNDVSYNKFLDHINELCKIAFTILKTTGRINIKKE